MSEANQGNPSIPNNEPVGLPEYLIFAEILPRLPVKTLTRFKSVSKIWHSTISSPEFINSHLKLSLSNPFASSNWAFGLRFDGCCFILNYGAYDRCPDDNPLEKSLTVFEKACLSDYKVFCIDSFLVGSSNGLVCSCIVPSPRFAIDEYEYRFRVYNPLMDECCSTVFDHMSDCYLKLLYGFGFVSSEDDYKVFVAGVRESSGTGKVFVYVYSLNSNEWKKVGDFDENGMIIQLGSRATSVNETLHWDTNQVMLSGYCICGFDLVAETFNYIPLPWPLPRTVARRGLRRPEFQACEINGSLCVWTDDVNGGVHLWMLKQYGVWDSWMKLFEIDKIPGLVNFYGRTEKGKFVVQSENLEEATLFMADLDESPPKYTSVLKWRDMEVVPYVESFVSPFL